MIQDHFYFDMTICQSITISSTATNSNTIISKYSIFFQDFTSTISVFKNSFDINIERKIYEKSVIYSSGYWIIRL